MGLLEGDAGLLDSCAATPNSTRWLAFALLRTKRPALSAMLETERADAIFWTFFGFDGDSVQPPRVKPRPVQRVAV